jgi:hypothetical protein
VYKPAKCLEGQSFGLDGLWGGRRERRESLRVFGRVREREKRGSHIIRSNKAQGQATKAQGQVGEELILVLCSRPPHVFKEELLRLTVFGRCREERLRIWPGGPGPETQAERLTP